jgi:hypothetical protein
MTKQRPDIWLKDLTHLLLHLNMLDTATLFKLPHLTMTDLKKNPGQRILLLAHRYSLKLWPETDLKLFHHFSVFNACLHLKIELLQYKLSPFQANCIKSSDNPTPVTCNNCTICFPLRTSHLTSTKRWSKCHLPTDYTASGRNICCITSPLYNWLNSYKRLHGMHK